MDKQNPNALHVFKLLPLLTLAVLGALTPARAAGPKASLPPELCVDRIHKDVTPGNIERRKAAAHRRQEHDLRQFKDSHGVITITNRPDKYRTRTDYVEISIKFDPIVVAPRFSRRVSATQYSSGDVDDLVRHYARVYGLDEKLVHAVIRVESDGEPYAVSRCGARGLMQLMPGTAAEMGVTNAFDPAQNIAGGTQYLAKMLDLFDHNLEWALAAYNAGPNAVKEHNGIPPYAETRQYVAAVCSLARQEDAKLNYAVRSKKPAPGFLPTKKTGQYIIHFQSGYTQPADNIIDEDPYYYVQYGNRTARVRKAHVTKIVQPA